MTTIYDEQLEFNKRDVDYSFDDFRKFVKLIEVEIAHNNKYRFQMIVYGIDCICEMLQTDTYIFYTTNSEQCLHLKHKDVKEGIHQLEEIEDNYIFRYCGNISPIYVRSGGWTLVSRYPKQVIKSEIDTLFEKIILDPHHVN